MDELAALTGFSPATLRYRIKTGKLTGPNREGYLDTAKALHEMKRHPRHLTGRRRGEVKTGQVIEADPAQRQGGEHDYDPDTWFRILKGRQEEIKLSKMREESVDLRGAIRRAFHFVRTWREMMDAWVSQEGPLMAADLAVDEGAMWRRLKKGMTRLQERCSEVQLNLTEDPKTEDEEQEDETAEAEPPKPKRGPGRPRKGT